MKTFKDLSIKGKLIRIQLVTTSAVLVLCIAVIFTYNMKLLRNVTAANLLSTAHVVGINSTVTLAFHDADAGTEVLSALRAERNIVGACLLDTEGTLFASYSHLEHRVPLPIEEIRTFCKRADEEFVRFGEKYIEAFQKITQDGSHLGTLYLRSDKSVFDEALDRIAFIAGMALFLGLALSILLANLLQKTISGPILNLVKATKDVTITRDYSIRVDVLGNDELGILYSEFNEMLTRIQGRDVALQEAREELEERVKERTKELESEITERKQAEQEVRESQARFRDIALSTSDWLWEVNAEGVYTFCSEKVEKVLGYTSQEIIGKTPFDLMSPDEAERIGRRFREIVARKAPIVDMENWNLHRDGHKVCLLTSGIPILDAHGNLVGYRGADKDITERKYAEQNQLVLHNIATAVNTTEDLDELFKSIHKELGTVLDTTNFYIALYDRENDAISLPYVVDKRDEIKSFPAGKTLTSYVIKKGESLFATEEVIERLAQAGELKRIGVPTKVWLGVPLKIGKEAIGAVAVQSYTDASAYSERDLEVLKFASDQIAIAIQHKRADEALRESEAQYRSLIENSNDAIYLLAGGKFEIINHRFSEIFDVTPEEVRAPDFNFIQMVAPRSRALIEERSRRADRGETLPSRYEFTVLRKDGSEIEVEASVSRIRYKGGRATQGILRDITERKKLETQLRQSQKMEAIGTLAGGIAHDFNNILMAMLGYADMAKYDVPDDSTAGVSLKEVFKAGARAKDLVKQILAFSRQGEQERKPIQIHPVVKEALKLLRASLPSTIEIRQNIDTSCGTVVADPTQIHQVLMNLCTNAYHAMREKGGVLDVNLNVVEVDAVLARTYPDLREGSYIRLTVSDTGCGMDRATQERIFEPFYTTKAVGEGTGMGLATVHGIVTSHGGVITLYSELGKGSVFHVYLPRLEDEVAVEVSETEEIPIGKESILLVDDEEQLVHMEQQMLERLGYHVTSRVSSLEALEAFRAMPDKFDLVITDQTMPNLTGVELAEELMRIQPDIPIVLVTGFSEVITPEKAKQMGIRKYLMKPITIFELGKAIRQVLDHQKEEKESAPKHAVLS